MNGFARERKRLLWLRTAFWSAAILLAALQTWRGRFPFGEDGVSYLDIADAYRQGDWHSAISAYWSPMYSWVLAAGLAILKPSRFLESTAVHLLNFLVFLASLAAFEFFLSQLVRLRENESDPGRHLVHAVPPDALRVLGYAVFIWSSILWLTIPLESPDLLLTVFVYLAVGLLLRIRSGKGRWPAFALFGLCLGLGYLTKSALFPMSFVFLGAAWLAVRERPKALARVSVALLAFLLVAVPWITVLSFSKRRLTFGDAGRVAYVAFANGETDRELHWHREFPDDKRPVHPTRRILQRPALYGFASSVSGTYPPWYDPSYWHEGEKPRFEPRGQLRVLSWSAKDLWHLLLRDESFLFAGVFLLAFVTWRRGGTLRRDIASQWLLLLPALAAILMYSVVLFSPRYVAVFVVLLWLGLYAGFRQEPGREQRALGWGIPLAVLLAMAVRLGPDTVSIARSALASLGRPVSASAHPQWQIAHALEEIGIRPGDRAAEIGYGADAYWARLAGLRLVAELFSEKGEFESVQDHDLILRPDGSLTPEAISAFSATGARTIVARKVPPEVAQHGWTKLGKTGWYAYLLSR